MEPVASSDDLHTKCLNFLELDVYILRTDGEDQIETQMQPLCVSGP